MSSFSFAVMTDTHLSGATEAHDHFWWNRTLVSRSREILRDAVTDINTRGVDFVAHCGDLTDDGRASSFRVASEILADLLPPLYIAPGNHDTLEPDSRAALDEAFGLGGAPVYRVARVAGWRMIFIDAVYWSLKDGGVAGHRVTGRAVNMAIPDVEMTWLREELETDRETPALCFMHPFLSVREAYPATRMAGPYAMEMVEGFRKGSLACAAEVKAFLKKHACVKAVFSGHGHWHECLVEDGVLFSQTAALAEFPNEMRLVHVSDGRLEMEIIGIAGDKYQAMSYVQGIGNRWVAGRREDRCIRHAF